MVRFERSNAARFFWRDRKQHKKSCLKLVKLILVSFACLPSVATAKEREPEPIERPGECPIDAPVRVANLDSLRQFEGLIGHCPEASIIESPAHRANRAAPVPVDWNYDDPGTMLDREGQMLLTDGKPLREKNKSASGQPRSEPRTRTVMRPDGGVVAIVPAAGSFVEPVVQPGEAALLDTDGDGEAEAILALRPQSYTTPFDEKIALAARRHGVDPLLLHAVITQESRYRHRAVSHAGARGLMQVMPGTGRMLGVANADHLFDPDSNIDAGAKLLRQLWQRMDGNVDLVLAAYNAGEGAVRKHGMRVPPYRETRDYVVKVKAIYSKLAGESGLAVNF